MANINLVIPDDKIQLVIDAFCSQNEYQAEIDGEPNPETKAQFAKRMVINFVKGVVYRHEFKTAEALIQTTSVAIT